MKFYRTGKGSPEKDCWLRCWLMFQQQSFSELVTPRPGNSIEEGNSWLQTIFYFTNYADTKVISISISNRPFQLVRFVYPFQTT